MALAGGGVVWYNSLRERDDQPEGERKYEEGIPTIHCYKDSDAEAWATANDYPIVYLDDEEEKTVITLPSSAARIESEAFASTAADVYELPATVSCIGPRAFANLKNAALVKIPVSEAIDIDDTAFADSTVTIECPSGSPVEAWARAKGIPTVNP